jgi:hypothetical protein
VLPRIGGDMTRTHLRRDTAALAAPARVMVVLSVAALLLLGALNAAAAGASPTAQDPSHQHSSFVQREAAVAPSATNPSRSHRLAAPGAFILAACAATIARRRIGSRDRRTARRRIEEFHVRLRGPPHLLVAHLIHVTH